MADPHLAVEAIRGLELYNDASLRARLLTGFASLPNNARSAVIGMLVARPESAKELMQAVAEQRVAPAEISAAHARQILALKDQQLREAVHKLWGDVRTTPEEKR